MTFSNQAKQALRTWLGTDTWDSHHPLDQARFYGFVQQLGHDGVLEVGTDELLDEADAFGFAPKAHRQKTLEAYVGRLNHILDYIRWQQRSPEGR